jgi:hypothetical protein
MFRRRFLWFFLYGYVDLLSPFLFLAAQDNRAAKRVELKLAPMKLMHKARYGTQHRGGLPAEALERVVNNPPIMLSHIIRKLQSIREGIAHTSLFKGLKYRKRCVDTTPIFIPRGISSSRVAWMHKGVRQIAKGTPIPNAKEFIHRSGRRIFRYRPPYRRIEGGLKLPST